MFVNRFERFVDNSSNLIFFAVLMTMTFFRNGFTVYGEAIRSYKNTLEWQWNFLQEGDLIRGLFDQVGKTSGAPYYFASIFVLIVLVLILLQFELRDFDLRQRRLFLTLLSLLPGITVILGRFGTLDSFFILFSILAGCTLSRKRQFLYLVGMILSHTESSLVILLIIVLLMTIKSFQFYLKVHFAGPKTFVFLLLLSFSLLASYNSLSEGRVGEVPKLLKVSVAQALSSGYWLPYSWFGGLLVTIIFSLRFIERREVLLWALILGGLGSVSLITADGTRVASNTLTFVLCVLLRSLCSRKFIDSRMILLGFALPALNVSNFNIFLPFRQIAYLFGIELDFINVTP